MLIKERGEGNKVERAVRRNQQVLCRPEESPHGLHHLRVHGAGEPLDISPLRIPQRLTPSSDREINTRDLAQVYPASLTVRGKRVSGVTRRALALCLGIPCVRQ